ncbi:hypothetical protein HMPREF1230_0213 [Streptococcus pyogenes GA19681]|nr:hypothetical protein HMPREF1230_0213 [Streptococcus pyogenes GA19681]
MKNIEHIRKEKGVSLVDIADCLRLKSQIVREKINGDSDFKFGEALKVQQTFFQNLISSIFLKSVKNHL